MKIFRRYAYLRAKVPGILLTVLLIETGFFCLDATALRPILVSGRERNPDETPAVQDENPAVEEKKTGKTPNSNILPDLLVKDIIINTKDETITAIVYNNNEGPVLSDVAVSFRNVVKVRDPITKRNNKVYYPIADMTVDVLDPGVENAVEVVAPVGERRQLYMEIEVRIDPEENIMESARHNNNFKKKTHEVPPAGVLTIDVTYG